ncbi:hypothetical protein [Parachryseolinea silvisoli]|uniref:hypothetical protein n=1 Tax=Parachryseolinea silvisoli TaxID=2873601 RepID=UPI002265E90F|nr:hypothetical protein [Parachryseolinea silvisoli]MCD9014126.1 hypothetical protein [Parachryseolinea silvisoli]
MSKTITISKRTGWIMTGVAILVVIILWIATARDGHSLLNPDQPGTTEPTPYDSRENGEKQ